MKQLTNFVLTFGLFCFVVSLLGAPQVTAQASTGPFDDICNSGVNSSQSAVCKGKSSKSNPLTGPNGVIVRVIQLVNFVIGVGATLVIIISGIRFITSSGDPAAVNSAKNTILYAVIGLVVAVLAQGVVVFVIKRL